MEAWACCLPGLWEGSQWFAKNRPRSWVCLPVGSHVPPRYGPRCLPALLCFLQLALPTGAGLGAAAASSWVFGWDMGKEKAWEALTIQISKFLFHSEIVTSSLIVFLPASGSAVAKNTGSGTIPLGCEFRVPHTLAVHPWQLTYLLCA